MEIVGVIGTVIGAVIVVMLVAVGVRSIPDIRRYLRIRHM
ncbi:DUF6893 family small protein [Nocardia cyriacigeorgica]